MENPALDWLGEDYAFDYGTPELPTLNSPSATPRAERAEPPSGERTLPLLRLSDWHSDRQYDKNKPDCIHYDFCWKVSQRENIRARSVCTDSDLDLVLAPGDFWETDFKPRLESLLEDKEKFPGDNYTCEETTVVISVERSRQRGLTKRFPKLKINWNMVDNHLQGLADLFSKGRKITLRMDFIYKEVAAESGAAKGSKKKKSATDAQKAQRAAEAGLWTRVYKHHRCRGKYCKQGPHCWPDERGNHHKLQPRHLEEIFNHHKAQMKEGEEEDDVDVGIEVPASILKDVLDDSRKRKAQSSTDCHPCKAHVSSRCRHADATETTAADDHRGVLGDRRDKLEEYCNWTLAQVTSDRWRAALQTANQFAMDQFLELNSILQHPKAAADLMVKGGVKPGIALQFVSNVKKFQQEATEH